MEEKFSIPRKRAMDVVDQLLRLKYLISICGTPIQEENGYYTVGDVGYLSIIDRVQEAKTPQLVMKGFKLTVVPPRLADVAHVKTLDLSDNEILGISYYYLLLPITFDL